MVKAKIICLSLGLILSLACKRRGSRLSGLEDPSSYLKFDELSDEEKKQLCSEKLLVVYVGNGEEFGKIEFFKDKEQLFSIFGNGYLDLFKKIETFATAKFHHLIDDKADDLRKAFVTRQLSIGGKGEDRCVPYNMNITDRSGDPKRPQVYLITITDGPNYAIDRKAKVQDFVASPVANDSYVKSHVYGYTLKGSKWFWDEIDQGKNWCLNSGSIDTCRQGESREFFITDALQSVLANLEKFVPDGQLKEISRGVYLIKSHGGKSPRDVKFPPTFLDVATRADTLGFVRDSSLTLFDANGPENGAGDATYMAPFWSPITICESLTLALPKAALSIEMLARQALVNKCVREIEKPAFDAFAGKPGSAVFGMEGDPIQKTEGDPIAKTEGTPISKTEGDPISKTEGDPISKTEGDPISKTEGSIGSSTQGASDFTLSLSSPLLKAQGKSLPIFEIPDYARSRLTPEYIRSVQLAAGEPEGLRLLGKALVINQPTDAKSNDQKLFPRFKFPSNYVFDTCFADVTSDRWSRANNFMADLVSGKITKDNLGELADLEMSNLWHMPNSPYHEIKFFNHEPLLKSSVTYLIPPTYYPFLAHQVGKVSSKFAEQNNIGSKNGIEIFKSLGEKEESKPYVYILSSLLGGLDAAHSKSDAFYNRIYPVASGCLPVGYKRCMDYTPLMDLAAVERVYGHLNSASERLNDFQSMNIAEVIRVSANVKLIKQPFTMFDIVSKAMTSGILSLLAGKQIGSFKLPAGTSVEDLGNFADLNMLVSLVTERNFQIMVDALNVSGNPLQIIKLTKKAVDQSKAVIETNGLLTPHYSIALTPAALQLYFTQSIIAYRYIESKLKAINNGDKMKIWGVVAYWYVRNAASEGGIYGIQQRIGAKPSETLVNLIASPGLQAIAKNYGTPVDKFLKIIGPVQDQLKEIAKIESEMIDFLDSPDMQEAVKREPFYVTKAQYATIESFAMKIPKLREQMQWIVNNLGSE